MSGSHLLQCSLSVSHKDRSQGFMRCKSTNGESFQGEWIKLNSDKTTPQTEGWHLSSIPLIETNPIGTTWGWSEVFGIDFKNFPQQYISFLLYGDHGTVIDGILLEKASAGSGLLGAAKDNRGHKYKLMG